MTNQSIKTAFERFWLHVVNKLSGKADIEHKHTWDNIGKETKEVVVIENIPGLGGGPVSGKTDGSQYGDDVLKIADIVIGDMYILTINGIEHYGIAEWCADSSSNNGDGIDINFYPNKDMTGAVIANFDCYSNDVYCNEVSASVSRPFTAKLTHIAETITTLPAEFLPEGIAGGAGGGGTETIVFTATGEYGEIITCNKSFDECLNIINSKIPYVAMMMGDQGTNKMYPLWFASMVDYGETKILQFPTIHFYNDQLQVYHLAYSNDGTIIFDRPNFE